MHGSISIGDWNGEVNWDEAKQSLQEEGIGLVFVRAGGDNNIRDMRFKRNFSAARKRGMQVGAVYSFGMVSSPEEHYCHISGILNKVKFDKGKDKLVIHATEGFGIKGGKDESESEVEGTNQKLEGEGRKNILERRGVLLDLLKILKNEGYTPIIRTTPGVWNAYYALDGNVSDGINFSDYSLWVFNPSSPDQTSPALPKDWKSKGTFEYWTKNPRGRIEGIDTEVCLNESSCTERQEARLQVDNQGPRQRLEDVQSERPMNVQSLS